MNTFIQPFNKHVSDSYVLGSVLSDRKHRGKHGIGPRPRRTRSAVREERAVCRKMAARLHTVSAMRALHTRHPESTRKVHLSQPGSSGGSEKQRQLKADRKSAGLCQEKRVGTATENILICITFEGERARGKQHFPGTPGLRCGQQCRGTGLPGTPRGEAPNSTPRSPACETEGRRKEGDIQTAGMLTRPYISERWRKQNQWDWI